MPRVHRDDEEEGEVEGVPVSAIPTTRRARRPGEPLRILPGEPLPSESEFLRLLLEAVDDLRLQEVGPFDLEVFEFDLGVAQADVPLGLKDLDIVASSFVATFASGASGDYSLKVETVSGRKKAVEGRDGTSLSLPNSIHELYFTTDGSGSGLVQIIVAWRA